MLLNYKPWFDHLNNIQVFVKPTIIHDNDGVGARVQFHNLEQAFNELLKSFSAEWAFNNLAV